MSPRRVRTWQQVVDACKEKGILASKRGSEGVLTGPGTNGQKTKVIIQHKCCSGPSAIVWAPYLAEIKRKFGMTNADFG